MATEPLRKTGIDFLGDVPWGTHFCHFFETKEDLLDSVLPFFKTGLEAREFCLWFVADPLTEKEAKGALSRVLPDVERYLRDRSLEIHECRAWFKRAGAFDLERMLSAWERELTQALERGFSGMRVNGSPAWLERKDWLAFSEFEGKLNEWMADKPLLVSCSYLLAATRAAEILDVARTHNFAIARRSGTWQVVETPEFLQAKTDLKLLNEELQQRVYDRTAELGEVNRELRARNEQQSVVVSLGQTAIASRDLSSLLNAATSLAAKTLGSDLALLCECLPDRMGCRVRAARGWRTELAGSTLGVDDGSIAAFLDSAEPGPVPDAHAQLRFPISREAREEGAQSATGAVVRGRSGSWGFLAVYSKRPKAFTPDECGFLQSVANVLTLAVDRSEVEDAQRRETEILQAIFDNIPVMISSFDASGHPLRVNREWEKTLGWTLAEAQRADFLAEAYPDPADLERAKEFIRLAEKRWADFRVRTRSGRYIETSWARFQLSDGSRIGFGLDITERKDAEAAQRRQKEIFQAIFDNIPVMISITDKSEGLWRVNREWERTLGWSLEEARHANLLNECYPDPKSQKEVLEFYREEQSRWADFSMRTRDHRPIETSWACFDISDGFRISLGLDITERKQAEAERARLLESQSKARTEAEAALDRLRAIQSITDGALSRLTLDDLVGELLARLRKALGGDYAFLQLIDEKRESLAVRAADGVPLEQIAHIKVPIGQAVAGQIAADGQPRIVNDLSTIDASRIEGLPPVLRALLAGSMLGTPLHVEGRVIGVVSVASAQPRRFTEEDLKLLQVVADRVAPDIERGRLAEAVRATGEQLRALSRRLLTAQEEERRRLAIELHDELGQVLTAVKINLASLERQAGAATPAQLTEAIASVDQAMETVRDLALDLRPSVLDDLGLPAAIRWYVDRVARTTGIDAHLSIEAVPHVPPELEIACFRVAQEALTNVVRHSHARNVWVDLHVAEGEIDLRVRDDGVGFEAGRAREHAVGGASVGLLGMQERVSLAGGKYELSTSPGAGTEVRARLPLGTRDPSTP